MLTVEKIINSGNCELVIKWSDGKLQKLKAFFLQEHCPCVRCALKKNRPQTDVQIVSFELRGRLGLSISFSSGCRSGLFTFNEIRSWLNKPLD